ncbi:hypothetical protein [Methylobacterium radiodurans]|uniref:Uncharacterized protein n=1 Tax=Methylobacterium radiodurans TaxID=2202828 RepID=A0A2U8VTH7_9HYPH|nr:hypothetical protein [Methylobacterium radiodurans]AWN36708.1 hypothetical protein DK427_14000 [Methylobacterium radiodurans]
METTRKLRWERPAGLATGPHRPDPLASLVRLVRSPTGGPDAPSPASHEDWAGLIDRVRAAAGRAREAEAHALDREQQMQDLMRQARAEVDAAEGRVRAAEIRAAAAEMHAETRIREAETRAEQAEARARAAEDWLMRIHETVVSEFADLDGEDER